MFAGPSRSRLLGQCATVLVVSDEEAQHSLRHLVEVPFAISIIIFSPLKIIFSCIV